MEQEEAKIKSLGRALRVLECFTTQHPEWGVTELATLLDMNKSNVFNIMATFQRSGYVEKLPNGKYTLGLKMLEYAFTINQHLGYPNAVYDIMVEAAAQTEEIVYFGVPHGQNVLYLYVAHPASRMAVLPYRDMLGEKAPLYATGIGKAILAQIPESEWASRIPEERPRYTPNSMTDYDEVVEELRRTRTRGFAIDNTEREPGVRCVGVPVYNTNGQMVAGMSTSGPAANMTDEKLLRCSEILLNAALRMKERIYR
ncbi:MAG: IclR family transcriptional regulator [Pseudoflavonifractor sp.]